MHGKRRRPLILQRHHSYQISYADYSLFYMLISRFTMEQTMQTRLCTPAFHAGADYGDERKNSYGRFVTIEFLG